MYNLNPLREIRKKLDSGCDFLNADAREVVAILLDIAEDLNGRDSELAETAERQAGERRR